MITEAIILAGGMGTRLREAVPGVPKAMAPVASQPFLTYVINTLRMQGIRRFIFSLGYQSEMIREFLQQRYPTLDYVCVTEEEPLGTGGAIRLAMEQATTSHVLVANGDTLFRVNAETLEHVHLRNNADCTIALKPMQHFDRYGVVETDPSGRILSFREKKFYKTGMINGGIYVINVKSFLQHCAPGKFSFEIDYLERFTTELRFYGAVQDAYFIDIGIPADYEKAGRDLERVPLDLRQTSHWTLFLDRDGVINDERVGYYVLHWGEFIFSKGVLEVFRFL
ncbi:MAG TPA: sugar phosphate nucleotidyltransferase, partial [Flavisolibacter sp.]